MDYWLIFIATLKVLYAVLMAFLILVLIGAVTKVYTAAEDILKHLKRKLK